MNQQAINSAIKRELASYAKNKDTSTWNKDVWALAGIILTESAKDVKAARMEERAKAKPAEKPPSAPDAAFSARVQQFLDNPMTPEQEAAGLRAVLQAGIAAGDIPAPLLDKLDKIIGVSSGEDEKIYTVDFLTAFPSLAKAVEICLQEQPKVSE